LIEHIHKRAAVGSLYKYIRNIM